MTTNNELDRWAHSVRRVCRDARRDPRSREAGAFVIFVRDGAEIPEYAPARTAPAGAYVVERWVWNKAKWELWYD